MLAPRLYLRILFTSLVHRPMIEEYPMTTEGVTKAMQNVRDGKVRYRAVLIVSQETSKL